MMDILFKAKRLDNGEWVEGYVYKIQNTYFIYPQITNGTYDAYKNIIKFINPCFEIDPETICQYTGLTDKNRNKIFEGDVIRIPFELDTEPWEIPKIYYENARVYFDDKYHGWYVKFIDDELSIWEYDEVDVEVIGNIFDNPELLENE